MSSSDSEQLINDERCTICLEDNDETSVKPCNCKQGVHQKCIQTWYAEKLRLVEV